MKKILKYGVMVLMVVLPLVSFASEFRAGENSSLGSAEKIVDDMYMAGANVTSAGVVNGDLFVAGGNVVVSGDVSSDLMVAGSNLNVLSNIGDDARVFGGTVIVNGKIKGDLMVGGGQVTISGIGIGGDATIGGGNVHIDAPVSGDLLLGGGNIYINAPIGGNVKIQAEKITLGKNAVIEGNLSYESKKELVQEEGSVVKGVVDFKPMQKRDEPKKILPGIISAFLIWRFFAMLAGSLIVGLLLHRFSKDVVEIGVGRPVYQFFKGILVIIVLPIASVILLMTMLGIPFGVLGMLGFVALFIFSFIFSPILLGSVVYRLFKKGELEVSWKTILLGVVLSSILCAIPFFGNLVSTIVMFITLGSMVTLKMRVLKEWR